MKEIQAQNLEIGIIYNVRSGLLDFRGVLLDIYDDGTVFVQSVGTGSNYRVSASSLTD